MQAGIRGHSGMYGNSMLKLKVQLTRVGDFPVALGVSSGISNKLMAAYLSRVASLLINR